MSDYTWIRLVLVGILTIIVVILTPLILIIELVRTVVGADKNDKDK